MSTYFQGTGYNSSGEKSQGTGERCRNCSFVFSEHYNGKCPCEECNVVHAGECPEKQKERRK
ncbi:MAG TPA: hypothetical protein VHK27_05545 [Gammaproteobacteria bacterium]|nr:hypothetical protein [Gammaproteobacteria bacterium]